MLGPSCHDAAPHSVSARPETAVILEKSRHLTGRQRRRAGPSPEHSSISSLQMRTHDIPPASAVVRASRVANSCILAAREFFARQTHAYDGEPMLVGIMANATPSALAYAYWTQKVFEAK
jgi:hypothetical protein